MPRVLRAQVKPLKGPSSNISSQMPSSTKISKKKSRRKSFSETKKGNDIIDLATCSERIIPGNGTSDDGIEVTMKNNGMELVHIVSSPIALVNRNDGFLEKKELNHTTPTHFSRMSMQYHPFCDNKAKHRVPTSTNIISRTSFKDKFSMLKSYLVRDEERTVETELYNIFKEMKAIDKDRQPSLKNECMLPNCNKSWNIDNYLDCINVKIGPERGTYCVNKDQRQFLQQMRGAFVHVGFKNVDVLRSFATKCGGNPNFCEPHKIVKNCNLELYGIQLISSQATTVRHLAIAKRDNGKGASFFLSKDDGRKHSDGCIPPRLAKRLKTESPLQKPSLTYSAIRYLTLGPNKSYYAELVSGQTFWDIGNEDLDFQMVMDTFDVHRVVFGSFDQDASWIVLSKDGRIAWRNIPCRLDSLLRSRCTNQAAPHEVSLGCEDAYFVKFLDGTVDYCLPIYIHNVVTKIESHGGQITNIIMNPEAPDSFIVRHTKLPD